MEELSPENERILKKFNKNGDGKISLDELTDALRMLGSTSADEVSCTMAKIDTNGDKYIGLAEFAVFCKAITYPKTLSFFAHPWHTLVLAENSASTTGFSICDLCREPLKGFYYQCIPCGFNLHPSCSLSSRTVRTRFHPDHVLTLVPTTGSCSACKENLTVWTYRCGICSVNLHYNSLFTSSIKEHGSISVDDTKK